VSHADPVVAQELPQLNHTQVRELGLLHLAESGITEDYVERLKLEFLTAQDVGRRRLRVPPAPGILHPYFRPNGELNGLRPVRYLPGYEPVDSGRPDHKMRYGFPKGAAPDLYLAPLLEWVPIFHDSSIPLYFTEGWKKAVAAIVYLGIPCLAYSGINSFWKDGVLLPIYNEIVWRGRTVYFLNDGDVPGNPDSLRAENEHARLLMERCVERVLICRYPKNCKTPKLDDAIREQGTAWYQKQVIDKAVEWDPIVTTDVPIGLAEEPVRTVASIPVIPPGAMYGVAARITKAFQTPVSLTYPAVLAMLAAAQLPIHGNTRGTLYTVLLNAAGGCKTVITDRVETTLRNAGGSSTGIRVMRRLPLSDRGLLNALREEVGTPGDATAMLPSVLLLLDELKSLFSKAAIENSTLYAVLNELFSHTTFDVADRKGVHASNPLNFNLLGNLPCKNQAQFAELFGAESQEGFYRRCLFGIGLRAEPYTFSPIDDKTLIELVRNIHRSKLQATKEMYARAEAWKQASADAEQRSRRDLLYELLIRVALVTSSANGDKQVTAKAMDAALRFMEWQERIRAVYTPATAKAPYAQCMDMVVSYLEGCTGLVNWRRVSQTENWHRREFSQHLAAVKRYLLSEGILIPSQQKGLFYYKKEEVA
jgi:hypothetical protein